MLSDTEAPLIPPSGATDGQIARARLPVVSQVAEHRAKLAQLDREQQQHDANRAAVAAWTSLWPFCRSCASALRWKSRSMIENTAQSSTISANSNRWRARACRPKGPFDRGRGSALEIAEERRQTEAEYHRTLLSELTQAEAKADGLAQELVKMDQRIQPKP